MLPVYELSLKFLAQNINNGVRETIYSVVAILFLQEDRFFWYNFEFAAYPRLTWNAGVLGLQVCLWHPVWEEVVGFNFLLLVCVCVHVCSCMHVMEHVDDRGQLSESVLPFHHMSPKDWIQVIRLNIKCLFPLSLLTDTTFHLLKICFILNRMYLLG